MKIVKESNKKGESVTRIVVVKEKNINMRERNRRRTKRRRKIQEATDERTKDKYEKKKRMRGKSRTEIYKWTCRKKITIFFPFHRSFAAGNTVFRGICAEITASEDSNYFALVNYYLTGFVPDEAHDPTLSTDPSRREAEPP
jgi:hypothetical protein